MNDMNDTVVVDDNPPSGIDHGKSDRRDCLPALNRFGNASRRVLPMINTLLSIAAFVVFKWAFLKLFRRCTHGTLQITDFGLASGQWPTLESRK
jgi:hypothetical protein